MKGMKVGSLRRLVVLVLASAALLITVAWAGVWILVLWGAIDAVW
jgi:hypothetical protein